MKCPTCQEEMTVEQQITNPIFLYDPLTHMIGLCGAADLQACHNALCPTPGRFLVPANRLYPNQA